jgi:hypothetical protein
MFDINDVLETINDEIHNSYECLDSFDNLETTGEHNMKFPDWRETRRFTTDLGTHAEVDYYMEGYIYDDDSYIEKLGFYEYRVTIGSIEKRFHSLFGSEKYLWDNWARDHY